MRKVIFLFVMIGIIGTANATVRPIPRPIQRQTVIIHEHKTDVMPYVFVGIIAGVIIYHLTETRCQSGIICTRF